MLCHLRGLHARTKNENAAVLVKSKHFMTVLVCESSLAAQVHLIGTLSFQYLLDNEEFTV
jgi:hypothetical protein